MNRNCYISLLMAVALPLLSACTSSQEPERAADGGAIRFTATTAVTRTPVSGTSDFLTAGRQFRVWAWQTADGEGTTPMYSERNKSPLYGTVATYDGTQWQTDQTYYWPRPRYAVTFYAVYPTDANFNPTTKTLDYTSTPIDGQTDLMYATAAGQRSGNEEAWSTKPVNLSFNHALSKVQFSARKTEGLDVTVTSLEICNLLQRGTLVVPAPNNGLYPVMTSFWNMDWTSTANMTLPLKSQSITLSDTFQSLQNDNQVLMLMPQSRQAWLTSRTIAVNDALNVYARGCYLKIGCSIDYEGQPVVSNSYIYVPFAIELTMGMNYNYSLEFGSGYTADGQPTIQPMSIDVTVSDWTDVDAGSISAQ